MINAPKKSIGLSLPIQLGTEGYFATNKDSISQIADNINNLLSTRPGERRFNNSFGSSLYKFLFDSIDLDISKNMLIDAVQRDINTYLTGVNIIDVEISTDSTNNNKNSIFISIKFEYNKTVGNTALNLESNRI